MSFPTTRQREPEVMDDPGLDPAEHRRALAALARVNRVSGTAAALWRPIRRLAERSPEVSLRVLDVACGGGDVALALARKARAAGLNIEVHGCDLSQTAIGFAAERALARNVPVKFFQTNVIADPLPNGYDIVCSSLFLHHLNQADAVTLLNSMRQSAGCMVLISDLIRSRLGLALAWAGVRVLTRCRVCHIDGPLSVRAAFIPDEILDFAARAGMGDAELTRHWPQRFLLAWSRS